jgi:Domain of unknown function (DUF4192)
MNATAPVMASLRDPSEVVAALPYLLGFHPRDSLVTIAIEPGVPPTVGLVLRGDLPRPGAEHELVDQIRAPLQAADAPAVMVVVVGGQPHPLPAVVGLLRNALADADIGVAEVLWAESTATGARWNCLECSDHTGVLPDVTASPVAAAAAAAGVIIHADRDELQRLVAPDDDAALARRAGLLDAAVCAAELDRSLAGPAAADRDLRLVRAAVRAAARGELPAGDLEVVRLAVALSDRPVRDRALALCLGETAAAAERLWLALTRATPAPEVAEPAALAALSAYLRGDGTLAGMALDRALSAWPGHSLATLVDQVVRHGVPPWRVRQFIADADADAELDLTDDDTHWGVIDDLETG